MKIFLRHVTNFIKRHSFPLTLIIVFINTIFASWNILNGDIVFNTDIARDFLLLDELSQKGLILIGPRASGMPGLFHGPLWIYLNYPVYLLGQGNPVIVGYFWIILNVLFLVISYFVASRLFNKATANIFVMLLSGATIFYVDNLFNPYGVMLVLPLFLYWLFRYSQTLHWKFLVGSFLVLGCMIQFQMAVGLPFLFLTIIYILYLIVRNRKFAHLATFLLLLLPFSTFLLFEIRHNFQQTNAIITNVSGGNSGIYQMPYIDRVENRIDSMLRNIYFSQRGLFSKIINEIVAVFLLVFFYRLFADKTKAHSKRSIYLLIFYFYVGFYFISIFFNGTLLYHYTFPLMPLLFLVFSSMYALVNKKVFFSLLSVIIISNFFAGFYYVQQAQNQKGIRQTSWQFQHNMAEKVFTSGDNNFGYLIYGPDFYAYGQKYAYLYTKSLHKDKTVYYAEKRPVTYTIVEPAPKERPDLNSTYWELSLVKIEGEPMQEIVFDNGFKIKKYNFTDKELANPVDPQVANWIHDR